MIILIILLLQLPDTNTVAVLTEPPITHVSIFSEGQVIEIIQALTTIILAFVTGWVSIQLAKVKSQVTAVHNEINSRMTQLLEQTKLVSKQEGKDQEIEDQKNRDK